MNQKLVFVNFLQKIRTFKYCAIYCYIAQLFQSLNLFQSKLKIIQINVTAYLFFEILEFIVVSLLLVYLKFYLSIHFHRQKV